MVGILSKMFIPHKEDNEDEGDLLVVVAALILHKAVDHGDTQGSHRPISFMMNKYRTRANGLP